MCVRLLVRNTNKGEKSFHIRAREVLHTRLYCVFFTNKPAHLAERIGREFTIIRRWLMGIPPGNTFIRVLEFFIILIRVGVL